MWDLVVRAKGLREREREREREKVLKKLWNESAFLTRSLHFRNGSCAAVFGLSRSRNVGAAGLSNAVAVILAAVAATSDLRCRGDVRSSTRFARSIRRPRCGIRNAEV